MIAHYDYLMGLRLLIDCLRSASCEDQKGHLTGLLTGAIKEYHRF